MITKKRLAIAIVVIAGAFGAGWSWRSEIASSDIAQLEKWYSDERLKAQNDVIEARNTLNTQIADTETLRAQLKAERERKNKTITQKVIEYVQSPDSGSCTYPDAGVQLIDAAATEADLSASAETAGGSDGSTSAITDREMTPVIVENYQTCNAVRAQLERLQAWADAVSGTVE